MFWGICALQSGISGAASGVCRRYISVGLFVAVAGFIYFASLLDTAAVASAQGPPPKAVGGELTSKRTAYSRTWKAKGGQRVTRVSAEKLHWRDARGDWKPFDLRPRRSATAGRSEVNVGAAVVSIPETGAASRDVTVRDGADVVRLALEGTEKRFDARSGDQWTAAGVLPGITRRLRVTAAGPKEDLVLAGKDAPRTFAYRLTVSPGLTPVVTTRGDLDIMRGATRRFTIPRAVMFEERSPAATERARPYELQKTGTDEWRVTLDANVPWLAEKDRAWPVALNLNQMVSTDTSGPNRECQNYIVPSDYVGWGRCTGGTWYSGPQGWGPWTEQWATVGQADEMAAILDYRFPLPGVLVEEDILDARLRLNIGYASASNSVARNMYLHRMTAAGGNWDYLDSGASWILGTPADVRSAEVGSVAFDVAPEVRGWIANQVNPATGFANHGLVLKFNQGLPSWNDGGDGQGPNGYEPYWDGMPSPRGEASIATSNNTDPAKRPVLDIYSAPPAQAGSGVASPPEGQLTSRFVELYATAPSANVSSAKFEYVAGDSREWQAIPLTALRFADSGTQPTSAEITVSGSGTNRSSESLIWDMQKTPGAQVDGPVQVRAVLDSGSSSGGGITKVRNFRIDRRNPAGASSVDVGAGNVDLLTGDLVIAETDAELKGFVEDLKLTRTYHSRGVSGRSSDMFGPGWISGLEADGGEMPFRSIYNFTEVEETEEIVDWILDPDTLFWETYDEADLEMIPVYDTVTETTEYAVLESTDGSKSTFRKEGGDWVSEEQRADLEVKHIGGNFEVTDASGGVTTFHPDKAGSPNYRPEAYRAAGAPSATDMQYRVVGGRKRLFRIVAPRVGSLTCNDTTWDAGCRGLELLWATLTVNGKPENRVQAVGIRAVDPAAGGSSAVRWVTGFQYDANGRLGRAFDATGLVSGSPDYLYDSAGRMTSYSTRGERPWTFTYQASSGDDGDARIRTVTRKTPAGTDATTTFVYDVPLSGPSAPNDLSPITVATWGQGDKPRTATAVFPPDAVPGSGTPSTWDRATIHYLGAHGKTVNVADPEHNITTAEYDLNGNVISELTARNRERALAASGSTAARAGQLSTIRFYDPDNGVDLRVERGPERRIRKPDGTFVLGHERTRYGYDNGKNDTLFPGDRHLVTEKRTDAHLLDTTSLGEEVTTYEYSYGGSNRGWEVGRPLRVTVGQGAEAATTTYAYHPTYPLLTEKRLPKATGSDSHATQYHYYGIGSPPAWCASGAWLANAGAAAGALCAVVPAGQPASGPDRLGSYHRYDLLWEEVERREAPSPANVASAPTRTNTIVRDARGREVVRARDATAGRAVPQIVRTYNPASGRLTSTIGTATGSIPEQWTTRIWDDNGRLAAYAQDAGLAATYAYDVNGRITSVTDARGVRALTYDDRDMVSSVVDSTLGGPISATRDADGQVVRQDFPDDLRMTRELNEAGAPTKVRWEKTGSCSSSCVLAESEAERDALGRIGRHNTDTMTQAFEYDSLGRLALTNEQRGVVCTSRAYGFDKNSNRTSLQERLSAPTGACGTGTSSTKSNVYDGADRLKNAGYAYDALGRTTSVPAADAPRGSALALTYDADDLVASISDATGSQSVTRDSLRRLRTETSSDTGLSLSTGTLWYDNDEDRPVGRTSGSDWERYIQDADGTQVATVNDDGDLEWQLTDLQGSVVGTLASSSSALARRIDFSEFGAVSWSSGSSSPKGLTPGWLGGHSKQSAFVSGGLVHMGARVYNPKTGRFLQVDPVEGGSASAYDYVAQDPLNDLDLDGTYSKAFVCKTIPLACQKSRLKRATQYFIRSEVVRVTGFAALRCLGGAAASTGISGMSLVSINLLSGGIKGTAGTTMMRVAGGPWAYLALGSYACLQNARRF